ncbi:MAG: prepilin-type N-terminal cleavage/methylation domain-containing protein [Candidatus Azotimanducaceae bacterium]
MKRSSLGMTLIEVMVVLAIIGFSLNLAIPSFNRMIARNSASTQVNDFLTAIILARSEALKIGGVVSVVAADSSDSENEFGKGFCVAAGSPADCSGTVIRNFDGVPEVRRLNSVEDLPSLQFGALGGLRGGTVQNVDFCSSQVNRRIYISLMGRTKSHRPDDDTVSRRPVC